MYEKINYTLVGLFVIIFTTLIAAFAFWLAKNNINKQNYNRYYCYFTESVDGLNKNSIIKLNGVNVGRLYDLNIDKKEPAKVIATLYINNNIKITKDMYAILKNQGVTGLKFINIVGGTSNTEIPPNSKESIIKTKSSFLTNISEQTPQVIENMNKFIVNLNRVLNQKNIKSVDTILQNSAAITKKTLKLENRLSSIINDINKSKIENITNIAKDLNKTITLTLAEYKQLAINGNLTIKNINSKLPKLIKNLNSSAKALKSSALTFKKSVNRGDYNLKRILRPAIYDLKDLSIKYRELADELKAITTDPNRSLFNGASLPKGPGE